MLYEDETNTRERLLELRKTNICAVCKGGLDVFLDRDSGKAFLACRDWLRTRHDGGIEREASRYETGGLSELNITTRREIMEKDYGKEKTRALAKYVGVVSLTKPQAREILTAVYPEAPEQEVARAVLLCASYGLNPLMKHVFLVKFNRWNKEHTKIIGVEWATIMGIKAKRLLSSRRGPYSYVDNTPRQMTEEEQMTVFGEAEPDKLWVFTKVRDPQTGAEAVGYGFWPKKEKPYGVEKGNTKFNMASIRSESQALDRLRPGEMPGGVEVMDEGLAEAVNQEGVVEGEGWEVKEPFDEPPEAVAESGDSAEAGQESAEPEGGGAGETVSATTKGEETEKNREAPAARRTSDQITPEDVPDGYALEKIANEVWGAQPKQVWAELHYPSVRHFEEAGVESAWDGFLTMKSARG